MKAKALISRIIICLIILFSSVSCMNGNDATGVSWSKAIAKTFMERYPDPMDFPWGSWCYPQGYMLLGIEKLWESTGDKKYYDYIMKFVDDAVDSSGYMKQFDGNSLDIIMPGAIVVWAYKQTGLKKYKMAAEQIRRSFDGYPRTSDSLFWHGRQLNGEVWIDGSFVGQIFLTKYGKYVADSAYCFISTDLSFWLQPAENPTSKFHH